MNEPSKHLIEHALNAAKRSDDVESRLAACLASPVMFGGQGIRGGALAAARAQLARPVDRISRLDQLRGDHLAYLILDLLGEKS